MGSRTHIVSHFGTNSGKLVTDSGAAVALGHEAGTFAPYELLLGGLSYCLFRTFESMVEKMQVTFTGLDMDIEGIKRDEKVATLQTCRIAVTAKGVTDQAKFSKAFEISTRYCSVFQTLSKVATMSWDITYV
jgi:putative redox protein